jgi:hypothetical protein
MIVRNRTRHVLHGAALSALLLLAAAQAALADPPGYLFQDFTPSMPRVATVPPHHINPARQPGAAPSVAGPDRASSQLDQAQSQGEQSIIR